MGLFAAGDTLCAWDTGQNPAQLTLPDGNFSCRLLASNAEGYYYTTTMTRSGTTFWAAENKQQAMQFVQTLFSEEVQKQTTVDGVPVLRTAIQSQWDYGFSEYGAETGTDIVQVLEGMKPSLPSTQLRAAAGQGQGSIWPEAAWTKR